MLRNYLKIALRTLRKDKGYALINVAGLAVGMAGTVLILLFVRHELGYEAFHQRADRIARFSGPNMAGKPWPLGDLLKREFAEVEQVVRFQYAQPLLGYGDKTFYERVYLSDAHVFEVFDFELAAGDPATALAEPYSMVVSRSGARKLFGDEDPLGKVVQWDNEFAYRVTGVMEDVPQQSHLRFDFLISFATKFAQPGWGGNDRENWGGWNYKTYLLLAEGVDIEALGARMHERVVDHLAALDGAQASRVRETYARLGSFHLQPLADIHLRGHYADELAANGDIAYVYIFAAVAAFILALACVNFVNLATARAAQRAAEVGLRKAVGAHRRQLVGQFLGESVLQAGIALAVAVALVELSLPHFGALADRALALDLTGDWVALLGLAAIGLVCGVLAGSYPALVLSGLAPAGVLRGGGPARKARFRQALIVFQFAVSTALLIATAIVYQQLEYCRNAKLGFERERLLTVRIQHGGVLDRYPAIKEAFLGVPGVMAVTKSSRVPSQGLLDNTDFLAEGMGEGEEQSIEILSVDFDFVETYGLRLVAGRAFAAGRADDIGKAVLLNEAAVRQIGWADPGEAVGKRISIGWDTERVIGVVEDFHFESLRERIAPLALFIMPEWGWGIAVRVGPGDLGPTLAALQAAWAGVVPELPLDYAFLDDRFDQLYRAEERLREVFGYFFALALFIACLGLFGLAAHTVERRGKELGVRKVLGASGGQLAALIAREFAALVLLANVVAWPAVYWAGEYWLRDFAYRIELGVGVFALGGCVALGLALLTVSGQAAKAALKNPVETLRYE